MVRTGMREDRGSNRGREVEASYANVFGRPIFYAPKTLGVRRAQALEGLSHGGLPDNGTNLNQTRSVKTGLGLRACPKVFTNSLPATFLSVTGSGYQLLAINRVDNVSAGNVMERYKGRSVFYKDVSLSVFFAKSHAYTLPVPSIYGGYKDASCAHRIMIVQLHKPGSTLQPQAASFLSVNDLGPYFSPYRTDNADQYTIWLDRHFDFNDRTSHFVKVPGDYSASGVLNLVPRSLTANIYLQFNTR